MVRTAGIEPAQGCPRGIFVPATAFAAATLWRLGSGLYLRHGFRLRRYPSSLYTFPLPGLARDCHVKGFPEFGQFCIPGFPESTQICFKSLASTNSATSA